MDFKDWKIKSADGKKAVLVHKDGHFMSVAMKSLSRVHRQQMQMLADGGSVDSAHLDPDKVKQFQQGFGGQPAPQPTPQPNPPKMYDEGTPDQPVSQGDPAPTAQTMPGSPNLLYPDATINPVAAAAQEQQGIGMQAQAQGQAARAISPIEADFAERQQKLYNGKVDPNQLKSQVAMYNEYSKHVGDFQKYVEEHDVNPRHFQESMGSGQKANAAIGLLLGGMAGGLSGNGGNVAMDFLNKQIDRDIDAQKANINNRRTVLGAYENLYGKGMEAQNLARATMLDVYNHKIKQVAAKFGTQSAQAAALQAGAKMAFERDQLLKDAAFRRGTAMVLGQPLMQSGQQAGQEMPSGGVPNVPDGERLPGLSPLGKYQEPAPEEPGGPSTMMFPDADTQFRRYQAIQDQVPAIKAAMPAMERSYSQARQAERAMKTVSDVFPHLTKERSLGEYLMSSLPGSDSVKGGVEALALEHGLSGLKAALPAAGLAGVAAVAPEVATGAGLAAAAGSLAFKHPALKRYLDAGIKGTGDKIDQMKQYNADKVRVEEALLTAFPNMGEHERSALLNKTVPKWGDSPTVLEKKASHLKSVFKSQVDTAPLELYHLMPGRLKK